MSKYRLGVDVGGTHTDLVLADAKTNEILIEKVHSTPQNPSLGVLEGVQRLMLRGISAAEIGFFSHGTTVTTNALLEMKGATIGMLITKGFRAIQVVQSQARESNQFELKFQRPTMLVSQQMTHEIEERIDYAGAIVQSLNEDDVRNAVRSLKSKGVVSFAVCYMFSFMNAEHEERTKKIISEELPDAYVSLSSEVLPRIREWPRMSTTMLNAYLEPGLARYAEHLDKGLNTAGVTTARRFLMQSNGGVMPLSATASGGRTVQTLLSGPAAGVQATSYILGEQQGWEQVVTMDMGGTSCDIAFIRDSKPLEVTEGMIGERRLDVPAFDISTISAGGGTIARLTAANFISVGPDSAGADPGPICYGNGGDRPTVTDADLVCGYLNPEFLLGGETGLDRDRAVAAIKNIIAGPMKLSVEESAAGIVRLINARMADEIRVQAAKKVIDLGSFTLVPFGGAGPVHAAMVADELNIPRILIPPNPGAFSALGLLCSDVVHDYIRSDICGISQLKPNRAENYFVELENQASRDLADEGLAEDEHHFIRDLDLRYAGQGYEIRTPIHNLKTNPMTAEGLNQVQERFHDLHQTLHGHSAHDQEIEVVSYRVRVRVSVPKQDVPKLNIPEGQTETVATRKVTFDGQTMHSARIYNRDTIRSSTIEGPAIIEQLDSTTVLPPGWVAKLDCFGNIIGERSSHHGR